MAITRNDIISKVFTRIVLGYDDAEVDAFLDEIMTEMEQVRDRLDAAIQDNEKLKIQVNRLNDESTRIVTSRQETNRLREENLKLQTELSNFRKQFDDIEKNKQQRTEAERQASEIINEARQRSQEIIRNAEEQSGKQMVNAEREGSELVRKAKESANQIARDVQDRERQIIDRAQQRARIIIESAKEKAEENKPAAITPSAITPFRARAVEEEDWPGWLDKK